ERRAGDAPAPAARLLRAGAARVRAGDGAGPLRLGDPDPVRELPEARSVASELHATWLRMVPGAIRQTPETGRSYCSFFFRWSASRFRGGDCPIERGSSSTVAATPRLSSQRIGKIAGDLLRLPRGISRAPRGMREQAIR